MSSFKISLAGLADPQTPEKIKQICAETSTAYGGCHLLNVMSMFV